MRYGGMRLPGLRCRLLRIQSAKVVARDVGERSEPILPAADASPRMAGAASRRDEELGALAVGSHSRTALGAPPLIELVTLAGDGLERHQRVRTAVIFGALAAAHAGLRRLQGGSVRAAGDHVDLACEVSG
jgi:hypothetical protein